MKILYQVAIGFCVVIHYIIFVSIISLPVTAILQGNTPLIILSFVLIWWKGWGMPFDCPLSTLECYFERKAQLRECRKFVKAWVSPENAKKNWINLVHGNVYIPEEKNNG